MEKKRVRVQSGEDQSSVRACYSQDGRWMFVCAGSAVKVYSTISHELVHILSHHEEEITSCCINPTNTMQLLTASQDGKVILWDYVDGSLLREIEFGVPLFELALRPGKQEPSVFFQIERDSMEVDPNEGLELEVTGTAHKVVVGLTSDVILHRTPAVSPGNQLAQATEYLELGIKPSEICFSFDGEFVLSFVGKTLVVCNIVKQRPRSFVTSRHISAIACHPSELCIATGNQRGEIELWWGWNRRTKRPVTTVLHWHAHAVADLCFTSDGTYLLSGGEECVLVVWQLASCKSHYRPRLGAQITRIACAPSDQSFAVSLQNNVIQVVSGLDDSVEWSVGGMRRAHTQDPKENGMKTGLIWDPRSRGIVANSNPGSLQWYRPDVDLVTSQLDVTGLNYVSRRNEPFVLMTVEHAAFSADGRWLATVEWRDDGKTTPELRLKFWQFNHSTQEFTLNTCIDPPHNKKVTSLVFQPLPPVTKQTRTAGNLSEPKEPPPLPVPLSVSTSEDGKFKSWVLVDGEQKTEEKGREASWACRSVGYYHSLPCRGACFSEDGSLLAVNFEKYLTLWDPYTCELRKIFSCPFPSESFVLHTFGNNTSAHYLLTSSDHHLIIWDLLSCSVLWSVGADVDVLVADPTGPLVTAFVPSKENTTHLYRFCPSSPTPVNILESVCRGSVTSAVYTHSTTTTTTGEEREEEGGRQRRKGTSRLYFQTSSQVLYRVYDEEDDSDTETAKTGHGEVANTREDHSKQAYFEVFGEAKKGEVKMQTSTEKSQPVRHRGRLKVLDAAPHVLPPLTSLTPLFLRSLLPTQSERGEVKDVGSDGESEEREGGSGSESDSEDTPTSGAHSKELAVKTAPRGHTAGTAASAAMEIEDLSLTNFTVANYDWLTRDHFGEIMVSES